MPKLYGARADLGTSGKVNTISQMLGGVGSWFAPTTWEVDKAPGQVLVLVLAVVIHSRVRVTIRRYRLLSARARLTKILRQVLKVPAVAVGGELGIRGDPDCDQKKKHLSH